MEQLVEKHKHTFRTVLIVIILVLLVALITFLLQKKSGSRFSEDNENEAAINAMFEQLGAVEREPLEDEQINEILIDINSSLSKDKQEVDESRIDATFQAINEANS